MMDDFLQAAYDEAVMSYREGGIPIGAALVLDGKIIGRGHNRRVQRGSPTLHAEIDALESAGRLPPQDYRRAVVYTTLSPCDMCSGAILLYKIPRVVIGENITFMGAEDLLRARGVILDVHNDAQCIQMMRNFITEKPDLWYEDIGHCVEC